MDHWYWWVGFGVFVVVMLALDLGVFHRKAHRVSVREALIWSAVWISLALAFNVAIYFFWGDEGPQLAKEFFAAYLIEKSLSVDNIFVFLLIFSYFSVPSEYEHKILFWGILGALAMRALLLGVGLALIHSFSWIIFIFGAFLIYTGIKLLTEHGKEIHPDANPVLKLFRRMMPVTEKYEGGKFFVRRNGRLFATPLFVVLLFIETTDLIFAVDSIPAVIAISNKMFIVYTSNVFAILGLRALYFAVAGAMQMFRYLHYGLSAILVYVGLKMLVGGVSEVFGHEKLWEILAYDPSGLLTSFFQLILDEKGKISTTLSLGIICGILVLAGVASWIASMLDPKDAHDKPAIDVDPKHGDPAHAGEEKSH
jgi:tellurite resistance protein TerC